MILRRKVISLLLSLMPFTLAAQEQAEVYLDRKDGLSSNRVNCVMQDSRGLIWIGTDTALDLYDGQAFQSFPTPTLSLAQGGGYIWAGTSRGLYSFNLLTGKFSVFNAVTRYGVNIVRDVDALAFTGGNMLWIGTRGQGLFTYNLSTRELSQQSVHTPFVVRITEDPSGSVTVESNSGHLDLYSAEGVFIRHLEGFLEPEDLSIVDTEGTCWIPSRGKGLGKVIRERTGTTLISFDGQTSPGTDIPLSEDPSGNIWLGAGSRLYRIPSGREDAASSPVSFDGVIRSILADEDGVWIGTKWAGIYYFDPHSRQITHFPLAGDIDILCRLRNGTLMAGFEHGLFLYNATRQCFEPDLNRKDITIVLDGEKSLNKNLVEFEVVSKGHVTALTEDLSGHLYMCTSNHGLFRKNLDTGGWEHLVSSKGGDDIIPGNKITCLHTGQDGSVWAGTEGAGLWRLEDGLLLFTRVSVPNTRLEGVSITSLTSDDSGRVWIGSTLGILCYDPKSSTAIPYNVNSGYLLYSKRGKLLVGQKDAVLSLVPESTRSPLVNPPVVIRSLSAGDSLLYIPPGSRSVELPYTNNSFSINMACLSYVNPSARRYSWRLKGYDSEWTRESTLSTASYTKIPPGKYVFEADGSDDSLSIVIRPPWWRTAAAKTVWALLTLAAIASGALLVRRKIRRHYDQILKQQIEERERELYRSRTVFMRAVDDAIEKQLTDESFSIEALSGEMAMSRTSFFRKFKSLTGETPNDYLKNYRLDRAAELIRGGARVNEAALRVGFTSSSYFAKCFKARFGVLPKDYSKARP